MNKFVRCQICNSVRTLLLYSVRGKREAEVVNRLRENFPEWNLDRGLCERCLYLNEYRTLAEHFSSASKGRLFRDRVKNEFALLPTPLRLNADPRFTGRGITIAFLDSGFYPHPDLTKSKNRVLAIIDVTDPNHKAEYFREPHVESWHGTMTSVAAAGNGHLSKGMYHGIASDASVVLVKVMDSETKRVNTKNLAAGIQWVIAHREKFNIRVLSISVGDDEPTKLEKSPVNQAVETAVAHGIVVVAAGGNDPSKAVVPPASSPSAITVGGMDDKNEIVTQFRSMYHSAYGITADGDEKPELVAPAIWVAGPVLPKTEQYLESEALFKVLAATPKRIGKTLTKYQFALPSTPAGIEHGDYKGWARRRIAEMKYCSPYYKGVDGTSFSAPIVSSVVAQMLEANPLISPSQVKKILMQTAEPMSTTPHEQQGYGVLNPPAAVHASLKDLSGVEPYSRPSIGMKSGTIGVIFSARLTANSAAVVGDFNGWDKTKNPLHEVEPGQWARLVHLREAGRYRYKFVLDGTDWIQDPSHPIGEPDGFGGMNSVVVVPGL